MLLTKPWSFKQLPFLHNDAPNGVLLAGMLQSKAVSTVALLSLKIFHLLQLIIIMKIPGEKKIAIKTTDRHNVNGEKKK